MMQKMEEADVRAAAALIAVRCRSVIQSCLRDEEVNEADREFSEIAEQVIRQLVTSSGGRIPRRMAMKCLFAACASLPDVASGEEPPSRVPDTINSSVWIGGSGGPRAYGVFVADQLILTSYHAAKGRRLELYTSDWAPAWTSDTLKNPSPTVYEGAKCETYATLPGKDLELLKVLDISRKTRPRNIIKIADERVRPDDEVFIVGREGRLLFQESRCRVTRVGAVRANLPGNTKDTISAMGFELVGNIDLKHFGSPVINRGGNLVGIISFATSGKDKCSTAIDVSEIRMFLTKIWNLHPNIFRPRPAKNAVR